MGLFLVLNLLSSTSLGLNSYTVTSKTNIKHTVLASAFDSYLVDLENDSTLEYDAPWGELIEVRVNFDSITIEGKGIMPIFGQSAMGKVVNGYFLFFFDEDLDDKTDVIFEYSKIQISETQRFYSILYRFANNTYYGNGTWTKNLCYFDPEVEEDENLSKTTFHFKGAIKGQMKLKVASFYKYDIQAYRNPPYKLGGDLIPNCQWNAHEAVNVYTSLQTPEKLVNDTRFTYPDETITLYDPPPASPPPPPPSIMDYLNIMNEWIMNNIVTVSLIAFFVATIIYSVIRKAHKRKIKTRLDTLEI